MAQILPNEHLGSMLAQSLGTGLTSGLQGLAQNKMQEIMEQKQIQKNAQFWKSAGLPDNVAYSFGSAPADVQKALLDRLEGISFGDQEGTRQSTAQPESIQSSLQQLSPGQPQQPTSLQQLSPEQQRQPTLRGVMGMLAGPQNDQRKPFDKVEQQLAEQPKAEQPLVEQNKEGRFKLGPSKEERRHRETLAQQKELADRKEKINLYRETKETRHNAVEKAKAARENFRDYVRLEGLQSGNELDTPGYIEFLKRSGFDIPALMKPGSEEFQKIQVNFLRNAKQYFGSRVSNYEAEQFLKSIPSLSQSPEGRKRVIANLKHVARASLEYYDAMKETIDENKGVPPLDLEEKIFEKTEKRMDALSEKFREDLAKPVPKGQNRFITALQASLGSLIGGAGGVVKSIGGLASGIGAAAQISKLV